MTSVLLTSATIFIAVMLFCIVLQRPLFAVYNRGSLASGVRPADIATATSHGLKTDCIVAAYMTAIPVVMMWIYFNAQCFDIQTFLSVYFVITGIAVSLLVTGDTALYAFWHTKIDSSVLSYLKSPKGIFASVSAAYIVTAVVAVAVVAAAWILLLNSVTGLTLSHFSAPQTWWQYLLGNLGFVAVIGLLFLAIRGLGVRPNTPSVAYFSPTPFLNHLALNGIYNFIYSLSLGDKYRNKYRYVSDEEAAETVARLYPREGKTAVSLLNTQRPNVLLIVWESLCSRMVEPLGGAPDVTPNLNRLFSEGVLFTNCDCGSFLTDRGLACVLAGLPGQTNVTIGKYPDKVAKLPGLPRHFLDEGYVTEIVHSGDMTIRNINSLFLATGFTYLVDDKQFDSSLPHCKWGYHDEVSAQRVYDEIMRLDADGKPWFMGWLTLSSHEPFIVPYSRLDNKMHNAFAYTDKCVGDLIDRLKATPAWRDMLVVIVGDHGVHHGAEFGAPLPHHLFPRIPMLFTGGAVTKPMQIDTVVAQTDIPATILGQMGLDHSDFPFSRDVTADTYTNPMSMHVYNDGFVIRTPEGCTDFDNASGKAVSGADSTREDAGRKILQQIYKYISSL